MKAIHFDPSTLLLCAFRSDDLGKFAVIRALYTHIERLILVAKHLHLVVSDEHRERLCRELDTEFFQKNWVARNLRSVLIPFFVNRCRVHRFGDVVEEVQETTPWSDVSVVASDGDVTISWLNLLGSRLLEDDGTLAPLFSDPCLDPLVTGDLFEVRFVRTGRTRSFNVFRELTRCILSVGVVDPLILERLTVRNDPRFVWEKTGHGATRKQRRIIERVARESKIVIRSGTTHQNPQGGGMPSISPMSVASDFSFTVRDGADTISGVYSTLAKTVDESAVALRILRDTLNAVLRR